MKLKLISFSLFGSETRYSAGALKNLELQKAIYPDWTCRFYISQEISNNLISELSGRGAEIVKKTRTDLIDGMFWRFLPASDQNIDALIVRDTDSRLNTREKSAVDEWLASGSGFHIIRDHPHHTTLIPGGLWGCRKGMIPNMEALITHWKHFEKRGRDQEFLMKRVYPLIVHDLLVHSDLVYYEGEIVKPFPAAREDGEFVGRIFDEYDTPLDPSESDELFARYEKITVKALPVPDSSLLPRLKNKLFRISQKYLRK